MRRPAPKKQKSDAPPAHLSKCPTEVRGLNNSAGAPPAPIHTGKSVLVVDDEAAVRRFVKTVLERAGFRVLEAEDGIEALRVLNAGKPDLLLTDIVMPRMGGIALAKAAVDKMPDLPILLMSGFTSDPGLDVKTEAFIRKPFAPTALLQIVLQQLVGY